MVCKRSRTARGGATMRRRGGNTSNRPLRLAPAALGQVGTHRPVDIPHLRRVCHMGGLEEAAAIERSPIAHRMRFNHTYTTALGMASGTRRSIILLAFLLVLLQAAPSR